MDGEGDEDDDLDFSQSEDDEEDPDLALLTREVTSAKSFATKYLRSGKRGYTTGSEDRFRDLA